MHIFMTGCTVGPQAKESLASGCLWERGFLDTKFWFIVAFRAFEGFVTARESKSRLFMMKS
jgi:hypothetical protein